MDSSSADLQAIITHRGAYRVHRLQFGIPVAPNLFQQYIETRLAGVQGVFPYLDDHPYTYELRTILDILSFYTPFLKNRATVAEPLLLLLDQNAIWVWKRLQNDTFNRCKELLTSSVLVHYDEKKSVVLTCDSFGIGGFCTGRGQILATARFKVPLVVLKETTRTTPSFPGCTAITRPIFQQRGVLSQCLEDGSEALIAFSSRTLSNAERNYTQINKEAIALVASVKEFHYYLYGRKFVMKTDHRLLLRILGRHKPTPEVLLPRMLRWNLFLSAYDYELIHQEKNIGNANELSQLPLKTPDFAEQKLGNVLMLESLPGAILSAQGIARPIVVESVKFCNTRLVRTNGLGEIQTI